MTNLAQLNVIVADMADAVEICSVLGFELVNPDTAVEGGHLEVRAGSLGSLEYDVDTTVRFWNSGWSGSFGGSVVIGVHVDQRDEVDRLCEEARTRHLRVAQPPHDAFWGSRYAVIEDRSGNAYGLSSPRDEALRSWPPEPAPRAAD